MAKSVHLQPIDRHVEIPTETNILDALLATQVDVRMACKGRGLCATCHVYISEGAEQLTPKTEREERTLGIFPRSDDTSRLSCQARVLGHGVVVALPEGMYIQQAEELEGLIGKRAPTDILHPIDGSVLVAKGKLVTRSRVQELQAIHEEVQKVAEGN